MRNAKTSCIHPVNILLPLPGTPSPIKPIFPLETPDTHYRRRSSTFTAIKDWALAVQPGSPAPESPRNPISGPPRRSSLSVARDFIARRKSISHSHAASGSPVVLLVETPKTSEYKQSQIDLTNLGYTSVFVHLDHMPATPSPFLMRDPYPSSKEAHSKGLKRIKSLGMLKRNRRKSLSAPNTPQEPAPRSPRAHSRSKSALTSTPSKKSTHPPLPPTLASELLLRQFFDGGSLEKHAKRVMEEQARDVAPAGSHKRAPLPVNTVYRDENGTLWRDEDEKLEREVLLPPRTPESPVREWTTFTPSGNGNSSPALPGMALGVGAATEERRASLASMASSFESLSQNNLVTPADVSTYGGMHTFRSSFSGPPSPLSWSGSTRVPVSPTGTVSTITGMAAASGAAAQNKRTRRRPAPLMLRDPSTPNFFDDSFIPSPRAVALASITPGMISHRRSSTGGLSAPPAFTEFSTLSMVPMKGNAKADELDSASLTTTGSRKGLGMRKISKLNLKSVKTLFGGHAQ